MVRIPWGSHGEDGIALVRKFWIQRSVWPRDSTVVASLVPLALVGTQKEHNMRLHQQIIPPKRQRGFIPVRGVQFWMDDDLRYTDYNWKCLTRTPPPTGTLAFGHWRPTFNPLAIAM